MNVHIIMDETGDTRHLFDSRDPTELTGAERRFLELTGRGFRAVALAKDGAHGRLMRDFDSAAEQNPLYSPAPRRLMSSTSTLRRLLQQIFAASTSRQARSTRLLKDNLTASQRKQFTEQENFEVRGGTTGKRYSIRRSSSLNVDELNESGAIVACWCFLPEGYLPIEDVMLAQKIALEMYEGDALAVARRYSCTAGRIAPARDHLTA